MKDDTISRQAAMELFKDDAAAVNELNNLAPQPDRMKYVQESVNIIMNTCKGDSIKDKAFRNAARMIQNAINGEAPDFETIEELPSAQQTALTADDIETIRIHLSTFKETLCNQGRWTEAAEYERLIRRLTGKGGQDESDD